MKLTKEDCYIALNDMYDSTLLSKDDCKGNREILAQLIEEHFSNPPLQWEDIQVNDVIYDKELKKFIQIKEKYIFDGIKGMTFNTFGTHEVYGATFNKKRCKNERFYRKEVQK